ncbi:uncharacterized protein IL334_004298 [Kwoniella shivajii]|uniref:NAD-dependent epimerase/dehydratase domain-containing protein n=1 Tax=Kwoniella shivajii TaxID=564305 RepID=A0ABZ1CZY9_9TREE|nr:hypothetical protein IL334_004298 [Kwoniella shivajii]
MQILLTGSSGVVGSYVLGYLLEQGHDVIAVDRIPLTEKTLSELSSIYPDISSGTSERLKQHIIELTSIEDVKDLFNQYKGSINGVIHLAAIPDPLKFDARFTHNSNVNASFNVLYTAAENGIQRITQASSVNFTGLSYTRKDKQIFDKVPITEDEPSHTEDPYGLSKVICEMQATVICRLFPVRIASLRFHHVLPTLSEAEKYARYVELWAWTSSLSAAQACLQGITSEGWQGHEPFNIVAPEIAWKRGISEESNHNNSDKNDNRKNQQGQSQGQSQGESESGCESELNTLDLLDMDKRWNGRIGQIDHDWWIDNKRNGFWDCTKANKLLGWQHNV